VRYKKVAIFDSFNQGLASLRVVNALIVTYNKNSAAGPWQVGDTDRW